jgi:hypothetical protein
MTAPLISDLHGNVEPFPRCQADTTNSGFQARVPQKFHGAKVQLHPAPTD